MNRLIDPPAIKIAVQRMICSGCGAEANATCTCGVAYMPKSVQAAEAIKANPERSNRAIAQETGLSEPTVRRARQVRHLTHLKPSPAVTARAIRQRNRRERTRRRTLSPRPISTSTGSYRCCGRWISESG
jgi:hypothetical protein